MLNKAQEIGLMEVEHTEREGERERKRERGGGKGNDSCRSDASL